MESNKKKIFFAASLILIVLIIIGDIFYVINGELWLKSITSAGFVLLGATCLTQTLMNKDENKKFPSIMIVGLFFAMLGDIILNIQFISGAALFAIGHVFYFVSYCFVMKFKWTDLIYGVIIFVASCLFITLAPIFDFEGVLMEVVCVIYALIISLMVGKSISNIVQIKDVRNIFIVVGSPFFFFSDLMLLLNKFADLGRVVSVLCLATYYPAQCVLALSISANVYAYSDDENDNDQNDVSDNEVSNIDL